MTDSHSLPVREVESSPSPRPLGAWLMAVLGAFALAGVLAAIYVRTLSVPFFFDDASAIVNNQSIRQLWPLFGSSTSYGPLRPEPNLPTSARPLVNLSLAINYYFGQLNPTGYRTVSLVIHWLTALLLWSFVTRTLRLAYFERRFERSAGWFGFMTALVWAVHPLATEAVVYATQRTELLMALFYVAALLASLHFWTARSTTAKAAWLIAAATSGILGALSKEMIASLPAVVLLYERTFLTGTFRAALRRSWPLYLGLSLSWLVLAALLLGGPHTPRTGFGRGISAVTWWLTQTKALFLYLKLSIWPWPLAIHHAVADVSTFSQAWPWLLAGGILSGVTLWLVWRRSATGFTLATAVAVLSPTLIVPLLGEVLVERRMYLPLAALVSLAVVGLGSLLASLTNRRAAPICLAVAGTLVVVLALVSVRRLPAYTDELTLWQDTVAHEPDDPFAHINLGIQLSQAGRAAEASEHFERAVELDPSSFAAYYNLAQAEEQADRRDEAIAHYQQALHAKSDHAPSLNNLGRLLGEQGESAQAMELFEQAIRAEPDFSPAHNNLGLAQLATGNLPQAIEHLQTALRLRVSIEGYTNLATAYAMVGRSADAIATAEKGAALARARQQVELAATIEEAINAFRARPAVPQP